MKYTSVEFEIRAEESYFVDLLVERLGEIGFDTFEELENGIIGYVLDDVFSKDALLDVLEEFKTDLVVSFKISQVEEKNWNEEWEKNFTPLIVDDTCYVRATFHESKPTYAYEIVIDPKMAFGTGHHQTTTMMMQYILEVDLNGKLVLDMGCGTGILAILAAKKGAEKVVAIDYDVLSYDSTLENAALNSIENIEAICGSKEVIPQQTFDVIFANINRNILLDQIEAYSMVLKQGGAIYFSGFYEYPDLEMITNCCAQYNIKYASHKLMGNWVATAFIKF